MKSIILHFDTDYKARLVKADVIDGKAMIKDKQYIVSKTRPLLLKTLFGFKPLYLVPWHSPNAIDLPKGEYTKIPPRLLNSVINTNLLIGLLRRKMTIGEKANPLSFFLGIGLGMIVLYFVVSFGLIPGL